MLSASDHAKARQAYIDTVKMLGVPMTWTQTQAPNATFDTVAGFKSVSWNDQELINSYGIGAKIFTVLVEDIPIIIKFDTMVVLAEKYTIDAVMPVHLNGEHLFHKCVSKGK